ncbi:amino acid ABC transporter permease [Moorella sp. E308F]|uniref:ABC transporter permease n=1 Tax=unclassified Neomoorella TaxID=2676739 RepID=UPI0010FFBCF0|nr:MULTISPECIES: ABC transporter permease [unclassified Moorella (in: firmicutes)]GEA16108.1 amino acid ABC transporter permease [Moorella sp. E308F]GEA19047.1 amino acid ABC transporter permease [Moorella sp. E306M]
MDRVLALSWQHLSLSVIGVALAAAGGIPLGILLTRYRWLAKPVMAATEVIQTIPSLAMLALLMMLFGLGDTTLVVSLFLYSLLPIVRNTYTGLLGVEPGLLEAGKGMGMTRSQLIWRVQVPIALPVILAGLRVALVTAIGIATIGVLIGAGGLGTLIWRGIQTRNNTMVLMGAVPAALLAILTDAGLALLEQALVPRGLKKKAVSAL